MTAGAATRRARPLLGTLVEVGLVGTPCGPAADAIVHAAFDAIGRVQSALSRFDPASDVGRFNAAPAGLRLGIGQDAREVLAAAAALRDGSGGAFDPTLGTGPFAWRLDGARLVKEHAAVRLDLGGIAKGHAVDRAVDAMRAAGATGGWVNAGGDLRVFGEASVPVRLRDELHGGVREFGVLEDGALCTSRFGADAHGALAGVHVSVAAPHCLWADALTKVAAALGPAAGPLLDAHGAMAWRHDASPSSGGTLVA